MRNKIDREIYQVWLEESEGRRQQPGCAWKRPKYYHNDSIDGETFIFDDERTIWGYESPEDAFERILTYGYDLEDIEEHPYEVIRSILLNGIQDQDDIDVINTATLWLNNYQRNQIMREFFPRMFSKEIRDKRRNKKNFEERLIKAILEFAS